MGTESGLSEEGVASTDAAGRGLRTVGNVMGEDLGRKVGTNRGF